MAVVVDILVGRGEGQVVALEVDGSCAEQGRVPSIGGVNVNGRLLLAITQRVRVAPFVRSCKGELFL